MKSKPHKTPLPKPTGAKRDAKDSFGRTATYIEYQCPKHHSVFWREVGSSPYGCNECLIELRRPAASNPSGRGKANRNPELVGKVLDVKYVGRPQETLQVFKRRGGNTLVVWNVRDSEGNLKPFNPSATMVRNGGSFYFQGLLAPGARAFDEDPEPYSVTIPPGATSAQVLDIILLALDSYPTPIPPAKLEGVFDSGRRGPGRIEMSWGVVDGSKITKANPAAWRPRTRARRNPGQEIGWEDAPPRNLRHTELPNGFRVSTADVRCMVSDPEYGWETLVLLPDSMQDVDGGRYRTPEEALKAHAQLVAEYANGIPHAKRRGKKRLSRQLYTTRRELSGAPLDMSTALAVTRSGGVGLRNPLESRLYVILVNDPGESGWHRVGEFVTSRPPRQWLTALDSLLRSAE